MKAPARKRKVAAKAKGGQPKKLQRGTTPDTASAKKKGKGTKTPPITYHRTSKKNVENFFEGIKESAQKKKAAASAAK